MGAGEVGIPSTMTWALVPVRPKELTPARGRRPVLGHGPLEDCTLTESSENGI